MSKKNPQPDLENQPLTNITQTGKVPNFKNSRYSGPFQKPKLDPERQYAQNLKDILAALEDKGSIEIVEIMKWELTEIRSGRMKNASIFHAIAYHYALDYFLLISAGQGKSWEFLVPLSNLHLEGLVPGMDTIIDEIFRIGEAKGYLQVSQKFHDALLKAIQLLIDYKKSGYKAQSIDKARLLELELDEDETVVVRHDTIDSMSEHERRLLASPSQEILNYEAHAIDSIFHTFDMVISELREDKSKKQPTKMELMIELFRTKLSVGSTVTIDDLAPLFEGTYDSRRAASNLLRKLSTRLEKHGFRIGPIEGYHIIPLDKP